MTVLVESAQVAIAMPLVVLLEQPPLPLASGSWKDSPLISTALPADTTPVAGTPACVPSQPDRLPAKLYVNDWALEFRPGEKFAVPWSWHPPTDCASEGAAVPPAKTDKPQIAAMVNLANKASPLPFDRDSRQRVRSESGSRIRPATPPVGLPKERGSSARAMPHDLWASYPGSTDPNRTIGSGGTTTAPATPFGAGVFPEGRCKGVKLCGGATSAQAGAQHRLLGRRPPAGDRRDDRRG